MIPYITKFADHEPDFIFNDFRFMLTCSACPEQYDVLYKSLDGELYQVGYVRLRMGKLSCAFPDVGGEIIYQYIYENEKFLGRFLDERDRITHLEAIAKIIKTKLEGISYGYS